jgi:hypothetical protein
MKFWIYSLIQRDRFDGGRKKFGKEKDEAFK